MKCFEICHEHLKYILELEKNCDNDSTENLVKTPQISQKYYAF